MEFIMKLNKAFSLRVRELLKQKKMTQYKLAQETGLYHSTMTDILNCKYQTPNFRNMALIIRALDMTMADFFDRNKEPFAMPPLKNTFCDIAYKLKCEKILINCNR